MRFRPIVSVTLLAALAACGVPQQTAVAPGSPAEQPARVAPPVAVDGIPADGQVYPTGNTYRVMAVEELPIVGVTVDSQVSSFPKERLIDGDLSTQWVNGGYRNPTSWAAVELASNATIGSIGIKTGPSHPGSNYDVQVSSDGSNWTTALANQTNSTWNLEMKTLPSGTTGRYVRIFWRNSTTNSAAHFAIFELNVNGESSGTATPSPVTSATPSPVTTATPSTSPSSPPPSSGSVTKVSASSVTASSTYSGLTPQRAVDGDIHTQWANGGYKEATAWLSLQFGQTYNFKDIRIKTGALPSGVTYVVEVSPDGNSWSPASGSLTNTTWNMETKAVSGQGKFLRVRFTNSPTNPMARFSVFEVEVYAGEVAAADPSFPIAATAEVREDHPAIAFNSSANENLVVWFKGGMSGGPDEIRAQRMTPDGAKIGGSFAIATGVGSRWLPDVVFNPTTNEYVVVWEERNDSPSKILLQRVKPDGSLNGGVVNLTAGRTDNASAPHIAYNSAANEYMVVWEENPAPQLVAVGQRVNASGAPIGEVITFGTDSYQPVVAASANANGYAVAWQVFAFAESPEAGKVVVQTLDSTGAPVGGRHALDGGPQEDVFPHLTFNWKANEYLVTWRRYDGGNSQALAQRISDTGALVGDIIRLTDLRPTLLDPRATYNGRADQYLITWAEPYNPTSEDWPPDIMGLRLSGTGSILGASFPLVDAYGYQRSQSVIYNFAADSFTLVWSDERNASIDSQSPLKSDVYGRIFK